MCTYLTKKSSRSLRSLGRKHAGRLRHYAPHVCAPYLKVIASDTGARDGIGVEIYAGNNMVMEIFRDDTKKKREVTLFQDELDLELVEQAITLFKEEIPEDFQD